MKALLKGDSPSQRGQPFSKGKTLLKDESCFQRAKLLSKGKTLPKGENSSQTRKVCSNVRGSLRAVPYRSHEKREVPRRDKADRSHGLFTDAGAEIVRPDVHCRLQLDIPFLSQARIVVEAADHVVLSPSSRTQSFKLSHK
jgi:hypothetical protein